MPDIATETLVLLGMLAAWIVICWLADLID